MIIRSQRKGMILNMDCITKIYVDEVVYQDMKRIEYGIVADKEIIAVYSIEEKAIKVLDMICQQYMKNQALYIDRENNARVIPQNSVFQMPADEDVEV